MDFSGFKIHDWLMVGGGAAMLILGFALDWTSVSQGGFSASGDGPFDYFFTGGIAWILVVAVGILAFLHAAEILPYNRPWALIFVGATGLATLLMVLRIILGADVEGAAFFDDVLSVDRGIGMYGALVWSGIGLAGAVMAYRFEGGNLADLADMDKLKSAFGAGPGEDTPPPPPPPPPPEG